MKLTRLPKVKEVFDNYPTSVQSQMLHLRKTVLQVAETTDGVNELEETLKWGEPSYLTKHGSTIRIDWKAKTPNQYAIYFKCTSKLVPTFKAIYGDIFKYENNRAIVFQLEDKIPKEINHCITLALRYHKVKQLPFLGT